MFYTQRIVTKYVLNTKECSKYVFLYKYFLIKVYLKKSKKIYIIKSIFFRSHKKTQLSKIYRNTEIQNQENRLHEYRIFNKNKKLMYETNINIKNMIFLKLGK